MPTKLTDLPPVPDTGPLDPSKAYDADVEGMQAEQPIKADFLVGRPDQHTRSPNGRIVRNNNRLIKT
jgi:hypothetical protein